MQVLARLTGRRPRIPYQWFYALEHWPFERFKWSMAALEATFFVLFDVPLSTNADPFPRVFRSEDDSDAEDSDGEVAVKTKSYDDGFEFDLKGDEHEAHLRSEAFVEHFFLSCQVWSRGWGGSLGRDHINAADVCAALASMRRILDPAVVHSLMPSIPKDLEDPNEDSDDESDDDYVPGNDPEGMSYDYDEQIELVTVDQGGGAHGMESLDCFYFCEGNFTTHVYTMNGGEGSQCEAGYPLVEFALENIDLIRDMKNDDDYYCERKACYDRRCCHDECHCVMAKPIFEHAIARQNTLFSTRPSLSREEYFEGISDEVHKIVCEEGRRRARTPCSCTAVLSRRNAREKYDSWRCHGQSSPAAGRAWLEGRGVKVGTRN